METKIASYQEKNIRLQLVRIKKKEPGFSIEDLYEEVYQIRKNRKVLCNFNWEGEARQEFNSLIQQYLLKTKIHL